MGKVDERQDYTPDGQELPPWLAYEEVVTTVDGVAVTTGTVVQLPQMYYGPSIPLGDGWAYGGSVSPTGSADAVAETDSIAMTDPVAASSVDSSEGAAALTISPSPSDAASASATVATSISTTSSSSAGLPTASPPPAPSAPPASSNPIATSSSLPSSSASIAPLPTSGFSFETPRTPTLTVLIPSLLGSLLVAFLLLLLVVCYRRKGDYRRAGTTEPTDRSDQFGLGSEQPRKLLGVRGGRGRYGKVALVEPGEGGGPGSVPGDSAQYSDGMRPGTAIGAGAAILSDADCSSTYPQYADPSTSGIGNGTIPSRAAEGDTTDLSFVHPDPAFSSQDRGILSRLSTGFGLGLGVGLGAAPITRQFSNGTAEKGHGSGLGARLPSWVQVAEIGTAVRRHVSSSTFGRVISRASGYGAISSEAQRRMQYGDSYAYAGDIGASAGGIGEKVEEKESHMAGIEGDAVVMGLGMAGVAAGVAGKRTPDENERSQNIDEHGAAARVQATSGSNSTSIPPSHSQSNTRSIGDSELFYAAPPNASTFIHNFFRSRSSRETDNSTGSSGRDGGSSGGRASGHTSSGRSLASTHASTSGSNFSTAQSHAGWSDESRGTVITRDSRAREAGVGAGGGWRARARAFAGDDYGVRVPPAADLRDMQDDEHGDEGGGAGERSNAALPLGANDVLPAYTSTAHGTPATSEAEATGIEANNRDTIRARRQGHVAADATSTTATGVGAGHIRTISVGIPYTPASRAASVPSFRSSDSNSASASASAPSPSPTRPQALVEQEGTAAGTYLSSARDQGPPARGIERTYGYGYGRSRFPSIGGERLDFPLPPSTTWMGVGEGESDSMLAASEYHSAHSNVSSRQPSRRASPHRPIAANPGPQGPTSSTKSPQFGDAFARHDPPAVQADPDNKVLNTMRRAFGISHLFRSSPSASATPSGAPVRPGRPSASERTKSFDSRYSYALASGPDSAGLSMEAGGSVEGPLSAKAIRAASGRPLSAGLIQMTAGTEREGAQAQASLGEAGLAAPDRTRLGPRAEAGGVKPRLASRSGVTRAQEWDEFGQLRDRRQPPNVLSSVARQSHIGSIHHESDTSPSVYSRGASSSGAYLSDASHAGSDSVAPSVERGRGHKRKPQDERPAGSGGSMKDGSVGSGASKVSKVSLGVRNQALRGRRSTATLVRSLSLKSTTTHTTHGIPQLSSSASTPMPLNSAQLPQDALPATPMQSAPARFQHAPRLAPLSLSTPPTSTDDNHK